MHLSLCSRRHIIIVRQYNQFKGMVLQMLFLTEAQARKLLNQPIRKNVRCRKPAIVFQSKADWKLEMIKGGVLLTIPECMPSLNVWKDWSYYKQSEFKTRLTLSVSMLALKYRNMAKEKARVEISHYHRVDRERDPDNYAPKFILDALKNAGLIVDDNSKVLELPEPKFFVDKEYFRTEVRVLY